MDRRTHLKPRRTTVPAAQAGPFPHTIPVNQAAAYPVCDGFTIEQGKSLRVDIQLATATAAGGNTVTFTLQTSPGQDTAGNDVWVDVKAATALAANVTAPGSYITIRLLDTVAADQPFLPLAGKCRVVATTGATATAVVQNVFVL